MSASACRALRSKRVDAPAGSVGHQASRAASTDVRVLAGRAPRAIPRAPAHPRARQLLAHALHALVRSRPAVRIRETAAGALGDAHTGLVGRAAAPSAPAHPRRRAGLVRRALVVVPTMIVLGRRFADGVDAHAGRAIGGSRAAVLPLSLELPAMVDALRRVECTTLGPLIPAARRGEGARIARVAAGGRDLGAIPCAAWCAEHRVPRAVQTFHGTRAAARKRAGRLRRKARAARQARCGCAAAAASARTPRPALRACAAVAGVARYATRTSGSGHACHTSAADVRDARAAASDGTGYDCSQCRTP